MEENEGPRFEYRAWAEAFPSLPRPEQEPWHDETYLIALGALDKSLKIRGDRLEIKELVQDRDGLQLWRPAALLTFPIPAATVEREVMVQIKIGQPLHRDRYGPDELVEELAGARRNVVAVALRKRRHLFEAEGCRAETAEVEVAGRRWMTAAAEHPAPGPLMRAIRKLKLDAYVNLAYPGELLRLSRVA